MKSLSRVRLFETPWTVAHQAPPSMGFSRQEYLSGLPFPFPGDLPDSGIRTEVSALRADTGRRFNLWAKGSPTAPKGLWVGGADNNQRSSCSYRKWPQGAALFMPNSGSLGGLIIQESQLPVCELEWNVSEQTPKGLCLTASSPESSTPPLQTHPYLGQCTGWGA